MVAVYTGLNWNLDGGQLLRGRLWEGFPAHRGGIELGEREGTAGAAVGNNAAVRPTLVGVMAAVIAVSAWFSVPFYPVPVTLQSLAVLVAGGLLGSRWGPAAVAVYLGAGLVGLPVFHNGTAGLGVLAGPTGGYLIGFLPAAFLMGYAGDVVRTRVKRPRVATYVLAAAALPAGAVIHLVGVPWLMFSTQMGLVAALIAGSIPFILGDLVKAAIAVLIVQAVGERLSKRP